MLQQQTHTQLLYLVALADFDTIVLQCSMQRICRAMSHAATSSGLAQAVYFCMLQVF